MWSANVIRALSCNPPPGHDGERRREAFRGLRDRFGPGFDRRSGTRLSLTAAVIDDSRPPVQ